jgi:hypothetical protein
VATPVMLSRASRRVLPLLAVQLIRLNASSASSVTTNLCHVCDLRWSRVGHVSLLKKNDPTTSLRQANVSQSSCDTTRTERQAHRRGLPPPPWHRRRTTTKHHYRTLFVTVTILHEGPVLPMVPSMKRWHAVVDFE